MNTVLSILISLLVLMSCKKEPQAITEVIKMSESESNEHCPVLSSSDWVASLSKQKGTSSYLLTVNGEVSMPTPGYSAEFIEGPTDRMNPPSMRLHVTFSEPKQMVIQVVSPKKISHTIGTPISTFRSVMVLCGGKLLAEINNVTLDENTI